MGIHTVRQESLPQNEVHDPRDVGSSHLINLGLWPLYLSSPALPEDAQWEGAVGMLVTEDEGE